MQNLRELQCILHYPSPIYLSYVHSITSSQVEQELLHKIQQGKANWKRHILCRNCLLKSDIEKK
jgi:hypothetical protein